MNYTQNLTETNLKRLFIHLQRTINSTDNTYSKEKQINFNYVKFKPKNQSHSEENEEIIHVDKRTNEHYKPPYAAVLKRRSNINLRRKLSKQNLAGNEPNDSVKN